LIAERWHDQAALTAHLEAAETAAFIERWQHRCAATFANMTHRTGVVDGRLMQNGTIALSPGSTS
jgi:hypothetical protein